MSAYIIANVVVHNPEQYEVYKKLSSHAISVYNAEICVRGGAVEILEGDWQPKRMVVLKFPTTEKAKAFYHSPEYQAAKTSRETASIMQMIMVEGF